MLFGQRISLLTPPEVVIFQVLEFFHYSPPRGSSVVRTKNFFILPPRGSNFSGFRIFFITHPLEVLVLFGQRISLLTPPEVVIFQVLEFFSLLTP